MGGRRIGLPGSPDVDLPRKQTLVKDREEGKPVIG
jgi:hypothetical protein